MATCRVMRMRIARQCLRCQGAAASSMHCCMASGMEPPAAAPAPVEAQPVLQQQVRGGLLSTAQAQQGHVVISCRDQQCKPNRDKGCWQADTGPGAHYEAQIVDRQICACKLFLTFVPVRQVET